MTTRAWLTPDDLDGYRSRPILLPYSAGGEWFPALLGAVGLLGDPANHEEHGDVQPAVAARAWQRVFDCLLRDDCLLCRTLTAAPDNLVGLWPMWQDCPETLEDISGHAAHGEGAAVFLGAPGPHSTYSASLNGSTSGLNAHSATLAGLFDGDEGTLSIWLRPGDSGWAQSALLAYWATAQSFVFIQDLGNGYLNVARRINNAGAYQLVPVEGTDWVHIAITWSVTDDARKVYKDGSMVGAADTGLDSWAGGSITLAELGGYVGAMVFDGFIGPVAVWDRALTGQEITGLV